MWTGSDVYVYPKIPVLTRRPGELDLMKGNEWERYGSFFSLWYYFILLWVKRKATRGFWAEEGDDLIKQMTLSDSVFVWVSISDYMCIWGFTLKKLLKNIIFRMLWKFTTMWPHCFNLDLSQGLGRALWQETELEAKTSLVSQWSCLGISFVLMGSLSGYFKNSL